MSGLNLGNKPTEEPKTDVAEITTTELRGTRADTVIVDELEAAPVEAAVDEVLERWSSHPIMRYNVAEFQFENGLLELRTQAQVDEFKEILEQLPQAEQVRIKKLDIDAARQIAADWLASQGGATKGIDSATGERASTNLVGEGDLQSATE
ncbi:MAG: hypothetical protein ACRCZI_09705 [Cetobacterium sp.]